MSVYLLPDEPFFPPVEEAEPDGLLAIGGDLSVERLVQAYASGIFPWFGEEEEYFWYSPDPRMVLFPAKYTPRSTFLRFLRNQRYEVRFDDDFSSVIRACAQVSRPGQDGTWISEDFIKGYTELHRRGFAHSVEAYLDGKLEGGLYGVSLGSAFFGESMFFRANNASKVAFHALVDRCITLGFRVIDCQVETTHLLRMGAEPIPRIDYLKLLEEALKQPTLKGSWREPSLRPSPGGGE